MSRLTPAFLALLLLIPLSSAAEAFWKAGVARANITPTEALWLAGYGGRERPAEGKVTELWIKVLALEDARGQQAILLTSDLLGIPQSVYQRTSATLKEKFGLAPEQIILSASHTHCGPVLRGALYDIYPWTKNSVPSSRNIPPNWKPRSSKQPARRWRISRRRGWRPVRARRALQ